MISHQFDEDYLLMSLEQTPVDAFKIDSLNYFKERFALLVQKSHELSPTMLPITISNKQSFGKVKLTIHKLENLACSNTFFIRIICDPFVMQSRKMIGLDEERLELMKKKLK